MSKNLDKYFYIFFSIMDNLPVLFNRRLHCWHCAPNGQVLPMAGYSGVFSRNSQSVLFTNSKLAQMPIDNVQPEQQPNSDMQPGFPTSSPDIGNTHVVGSPSLSDDELARLFDEKYGSLDDSTVLSHQEYLEHRKWQLESGFFAFRLAQYSGL